jgi:transposase InsO family protein
MPETIGYASTLILKAVALAARWAGSIRSNAISKLNGDNKEHEIKFLKDRIEQLEAQVIILKKKVHKKSKCPRYSVKERLLVIFQMEYNQIPRRRVTEYFCIARSTLYRWLHKLDDDAPKYPEPKNKTPADLALLVWEMAKSNIELGRHKIADQLNVLGIFLSASTVRNILCRPRPRSPSGQRASSQAIKSIPRKIPAFYPNHVWSVDLTVVYRFGLWAIYVLVAIDHFSRKVVAAIPLNGPNSAWTIDGLAEAFKRYGPPKHIITDQQGNFVSNAFSDFLGRWNVKQRLGAVGKHGSISVTERVIKTFKYEWLKRVHLIRNFKHLSKLGRDFSEWYNNWRPHMTLDGFRPCDFYNRNLPEAVPRDAKTVPNNIERHIFKETGIVGYRLKDAA